MYLNERQKIVLEKRILLRNEKGEVIETPLDMFKRVAKFVANAEKENEKKKGKERENVFWEGRIFRTFYLRNMPYLRSLLQESKEIDLEMGELFLVKSRKAYDRRLKSIISNLEEILEEFKTKKNWPAFLVTGPFDFVFFRLDDYRSAKESEEEVYSILNELQAFVDRHSLLVLKNKKEEIKELENFALVFIKLNRGNPDPFGVRDGKLKIKEFVEKTKNYLFAFSSGWEHLILLIKENEENKLEFFKLLFEEVISSLVYSDLLNRSETMICFSIPKDKDSASKKSSEFGSGYLHIPISVRLDLSNMKEKKEKDFALIFKGGKGFLVAGRDDVTFLKSAKRVDEIYYALKEVLEFLKEKDLPVKDIRIDLLYEPF